MFKNDDTGMFTKYTQTQSVFPFYEKVKLSETTGIVKNGVRLYFYDFKRSKKIVNESEINNVIS